MIGNIRQKDIIILTIAAIFLGVFMAMQYSLIKPSRGNTESSEAMAVEIERLAKNNADLKNQLTELTKNYQSYKDSFDDQAALEIQIRKDLKQLETINAVSGISGQGVEIVVPDKLAEAQIVDLVNAIKNIGADAMAINGRRIDLYTPINQSGFSAPYTFEIVGNSVILEGALSRKGGIVEQLQTKGMNLKLAKMSEIVLGASEQKAFKYAKIKLSQ